MKRLITLASLLLVLFLPLSGDLQVQAQEIEPDKANIELFWGQGCPHCAKEKLFLNQLKEEIPDLVIEEYEVYLNPDNAQLLMERAENLELENFGLPFLIVGNEYFIGYADDSSTGVEIKNAIVQLLEPENSAQVQGDTEEVPGMITLPLLGEINPESVSLPLAAIVLGVVDGFNPCAMWILIFLIGLLINMKDRKKLIILGSAFILTSGLIYFLFMTAWLNLFLFVGFLPVIRTIVGVVAISAGIYYLWRFWQERDGGCEGGSREQRKKTMERAKKVVSTNKFYIALVGIILLAISVNMIEMVCSAGLPAIFTHILSINQLGTLNYYLLMGLYILFFMIDDLIIFLVAVFTFKTVGIQNKYSQISRVVGGIIIFILGVLLIFSPETLMFG